VSDVEKRREQVAKAFRSACSVPDAQTRDVLRAMGRELEATAIKIERQEKYHLILLRKVGAG
jgi:cysteine sulfinate desulfinase/cysteine desulfurase-like protein